MTVPIKKKKWGLKYLYILTKNVQLECVRLAGLQIL